MYVRRCRVRGRKGIRVYMSIAHNVWVSDTRSGKPQSCPIVFANLGTEDQIDVAFAREVAAAVERCLPLQLGRPGDARREAARVARRARTIERFLRALSSRRLGLTELLPPDRTRDAVLDELIRDALRNTEISRDDLDAVILSALVRPHDHD